MRSMFLAGMDGNDSIVLPAHRELGPISARSNLVVPAGELWTVATISYQFYVHARTECHQAFYGHFIADGMTHEAAVAAIQPTMLCDTQRAMIHLMVTADNFEANLWTRFASGELNPAAGEQDGLWWGYRNESPHIPVVGPAAIKFGAFNLNTHGCVIYLAAAITREPA